MANERKTRKPSANKAKVKRWAAKRSTRNVQPSRPKPDWEYWECRIKVFLNEAVALSCDVHPPVVANPEGFGSPNLAAFRERLEIAQYAALQGAFRAKVLATSEIRVDLGDFARWAVGMGAKRMWRKLPDEFRRLVPERPASPAARKSTTGEGLAKAASTAAPNPTAEAKPQRLALAGIPKPTAEEKERLAPGDVERSAIKAKAAATGEQQCMLVIILALVTEIRRTNERTVSDWATVRRLLKNVGHRLTTNTIKKFLKAAEALKPAESPLEDSIAEDKPLDTKSRNSMLKIILALVTEIEKRPKHTLTGAEELGEFVKKVGYSLPDNTITKCLNEAKALKPAKDPPGNSKD